MSPFHIYHAAAPRVRLNFWLTVLLFLGIPIPVLAQAQSGLSREWLEPQTVFAVIAGLISAGIVLGEFQAVKAELASRARKDVVDQQFAQVTTAIAGIKDMSERADARWTAFNNMINGWSNDQESRVHDLAMLVARLEVVIKERTQK